MDNTTESYRDRENQWDEQWPTQENEESGYGGAEPDADDEVMPFPQVVGTTDPLEAVRDAEPYMPPTDPPVLPGGSDAIHVATGFGISPEEEAANDPLPRGDEDIRQQVILALEQDSLTSLYDFRVEVEDGVVRLTGLVPSLDDAEHATWMLGELPGVVDVIDDTTLEPTLS